MKKFYPNDVLKNNSNIDAQINIWSSRFFLFVFIVIGVLSTQQSKAQETVKITGDKDAFSKEIQNLTDATIDELSSLIFDIHPTAYIENGEIAISTDSDRPVTKIIIKDSDSTEVLKTKDAKLQKVKLIQIKLKNFSELSQPLDFSTLNNTNRLKYVYLQCSFDCTDDDIKSYITETAPGTIILYSNSTPL
jgi:hypothetical protein